MSEEDSSQNHSSSHSEVLSDIQDQEIHAALRTVRKFRRNKQARKMFKNKPAANRLFYLMSKFFLRKNSVLKDDKRKIKNLKESIVQLQEKLKENKNYTGRQLSRYKIDKRLIESIKKDQDSPQIIEDNQNNGEKKQENESSTNKPKINLFPQKGRRCYACKKKHFALYPLNHDFCFDCGTINFQKRTQTADLRGKYALVTGARIKIGYEITIKLLLDGATVIASTRFIQDAQKRYEQHPLFSTFKDRIYFFQCDFVSALQVTHLIHFVKATFSKLDILINNAAQTIARPRQFYASELALQSVAKTEALGCEEVVSDALAIPLTMQNIYPSLYMRRSESQQGRIDHSRRDEFNQPLDVRKTNSWVETIENVSLVDCLTTQIVNSVVPFHLIGALKCMMSKPSWVINVSAMEGVFYRPFRLNTHPHTNMAKASLNMITRTCSDQFSEEGIYMNSVDTGWVTQMYPAHMNKSNDVPLDCVDGAMRVLDPIYLGLLHNQYPHGKFFKDYKESLF